MRTQFVTAMAVFLATVVGVSLAGSQAGPTKVQKKVQKPVTGLQLEKPGPQPKKPLTRPAIPKQARVEITKAGFSPATPVAGGQVNLSVLVQNKSAVPAPNFTVQITHGRRLIGRLQWKRGLKARARTRRDFKLTTPKQAGRVCYGIKLVPARGSQLRPGKLRTVCVITRVARRTPGSGGSVTMRAPAGQRFVKQSDGSVVTVPKAGVALLQKRGLKIKCVCRVSGADHCTVTIDAGGGTANCGSDATGCGKNDNCVFKGAPSKIGPQRQQDLPLMR